MKEHRPPGGMALGKLLNFSGPRFPYMTNGEDDISQRRCKNSGVTGVTARLKPPGVTRRHIVHAQ